MPSPDLSDYVDLTLSDLSAQDIFDSGLAMVLARVPGYTPRETNIEMILLEAMAYQIEQSVFAINRLPGTIFDILMRRFGVERFLGAAPTTSLTFIVATTAGYEIPAGTRAALTDDVGTIVFTLDQGLIVPVGANTATGAASAETFTSDFNGIPAGEDLALVDAVPYVDYVRLGSVVTGGADEETEDEWRARGAARFGRLTETLVLPDHFVQAALENPLIYRAYGLDNYNPASGNAPGADAGHMTVAVYGEGAAVSDPEKLALETSMEDATAANLAVHIIDPTITLVDVTVTVQAEAGYDPAFVEGEVESQLRDYLNSQTWLWSGTVYYNELISVIDSVLGVERVVSLTTPAADLPIAGVAPLASAGVLTITVQA